MFIDLNYLNGVSGGDPAFIKEILQLFLDYTVADFAELGRQIREENWPAASSTAHKIKSSVTMLGNQKAIAGIVSIEQSAKKEENLLLIPETYLQLSDEFTEMEKEIVAYIQSH